MRRGGRLFIFLGVIVALAAAIFLWFLLQTPTGPTDGEVGVPTDVPVRQIVVARIDIPSNTVLTDTETLLDFSEIPEPDYNANADQYFTSFEELRNRVTLIEIPATEAILDNDVTEAGLSLQIPPAQEGQPQPKAYPFQANNLTGVADQITPGDFVDVVASFDIQQVLLRPGFDEEGQLLIREQEVVNQSTKTLVQNLQVIDIIRPAPPEEGTPTAEQAPVEEAPAVGPDGQPLEDTGGGGGATQNTTAEVNLRAGNWILILAATDQQIEVIKFSQEEGFNVTLVLRGRGDTAEEETIGATLDLLVSDFGLPIPFPIPPASVTEDQITPIPTLEAAETPTP
ncbi:MAG: flagellar protein FlgA [Chloroflexi bacterium AL-W]|nr:flagellar protein FlgA [Chloroflexi bacterium AL-N1]NOK65735.1 flagellar protein FlgA [Chloroflexi bacterium AL-N10]NOK74324.1 flagellar protein FlgA [Chloroflexi bacterium AL-N5]NOK80768.1 flagellar protein FlgA [Chloroflexi bacterium AL-W]NOK88582.1 flagellar protein FlgA [Chloroflexi bacterium AL-N15]